MVTTDEQGTLRVIDKYNTAVICLFGSAKLVADREGRPVTVDYLLPEKTDLSSIGQFSFSYGYMRMTYSQHDYYYPEQLVTKYDVLVDKEGNYFEIPTGYTIEGYSDGILLLSKDGCYGMYSVLTGKWIAQPVYTYAQPYLGGVAVIGFEGGKKCVIDTEGKVVIPFDYTYISNNSCGVILAYNNGWTVYNIMSK